MKIKLGLLLLLGIGSMDLRAVPAEPTLKEKTKQALIYTKNICKLGLGAGLCIVGASTALRGANNQSAQIGQYLSPNIRNWLSPLHKDLQVVYSRTQFPVILHPVIDLFLGSFIYALGHRAVKSAWHDLQLNTQENA